jgi:hypothetical protein
VPAGVLILALSAAGCGGAESTPASQKQASGEAGKCAEGAKPPTSADGAEFVDSAALLEWHDAAVNSAFATAKNGLIGLENMRGWTIMHIAIHDALNAIRPVYAQYSFTGCQPDAHPGAAIAQAGHDVLIEIYPTLKADLDGRLEKSLAAIPDGQGETSGVALGKASAASILAARKDDGLLKDSEYKPKEAAPGRYQLVPPLAFVYKPDFGDGKPFALKSPTQVTPPPPPALDSPEYAKDFNEVKAYGQKKSKVRNADQTNYANWWAEFSEVTWNRAATVIARERKLELYPAARMFALLNIGLTDATIAIWNAKRHYDSWRPITAIRAAAKDGNNATAPDPKWESFLLCPPTWEYPSAHSIQSATSAGVLTHILGTDDVAFSMETVSAPPKNKVRSFKSISEAVKEGSDSRVAGGIHFRFATVAGLAMGDEVAKHVIATQLTPRSR